MKKKYLVSVLAVAVILFAGGAFLLNPAVDLLENDLVEEIPDDGFLNIEDEDTPLSDLPTEEVPSEPVDPYEGLDATQKKYVDEIVTLVNEAREKEGLQPLTLDPLLRKGAQVRAEECVKVFSHTRPNGSSYKTAISEAGVVSNYTGENVACGHSSAQQVVKAWLNSPGHRDNILNSNFTKIGVGIEKNVGNGYRGYSWSQLFVK
jgi:uncharacterized protein YkwD